MPRRYTQPRLPVDPVLNLVAADSLVDAARAIGIPYRQLWRYVHDGIPVESADKVAINVGVHPLELWGVDWTEACARFDELRAAQRDAARRRRRAQQRARYADTNPDVQPNTTRPRLDD